MVKTSITSLIFFLYLMHSVQGQTNLTGVINEYSAVIKFDSCNNSLELENIVPFSIGDRILIIQMQGANIDLSAGNLHGRVTNYNSAGYFEFATIAGITGSAIIPLHTLSRKYDPNAGLQVVKVASFADARVTGTVEPLPWNGKTGGIVVIEVENTLNIAGKINVSNMGFRGGTASLNYFESGKCSLTGYTYPSTTGEGGLKGESISMENLSRGAGRGIIANGGGGGNAVNSGGGGGGLFSNGGRGGKEWNGCDSNANIGGLGGGYLQAMSDRLFMGGGGGAGQQNDNVGTAGGNGGGIILIKAGKIVTAPNATFLANGGSVLKQAGNDGAGGGGGGGMIAIETNSIEGTISLEAIGGNGGDVYDLVTLTCHGPGGGGSGGGIFFSSPSLNSFTNILFNGGKPGRNTNNGVCANSNYGALPGEVGITFSQFKTVESFDKLEPFQLNGSSSYSGCYNQVAGSITLNPSGNIPPYRYQWTPNISLTASASGLLPGNYKVEVFNSFGCFMADTNFIIPNVPPLIIEITASKNIACKNDQVTLTATGGVSYQWDNGIQNSQPFFINQTTTYTVIGTNAEGCKDTASITIPVYSLELLSADTTVFKGASLTFRAVGSREGIITWSGGIINNVPFIAQDSGRYFVSGISTDGCVDSTSVFLSVITRVDAKDIFIPVAFTPNGDGLNDIFRILPIGGLPGITLLHFKIYNRYGQLVFSTNNIDTGWDGTFKGAQQNTGTYIYIASFLSSDNSIIERKGTVHLIR